MLIVIPSPLWAQNQALPWLNALGMDVPVSSIHTLSTRAEVSVSDGLKYGTETVFHDRQRSVFKRVYPDRTVIQGVEGMYVWSSNGEVESELPIGMAEFILGHQFHAQILFYDRLHQNLEAPEATSFQGSSVFVLKSDAGTTSMFFDENGPVGMQIQRLPSDPIQHPIVFTYEDWRSVYGVRLPFTVLIDDGEREFRYSFSEVLLNEGSLNEHRTAWHLLTDEQKLLQRHRAIMDGHLNENSGAFVSAYSDSLTIASQGDVFTFSRQEASRSMTNLLAGRDYLIYDDLIRPIVRVSDDGTLGWVIVQISAKGHRLDDQGVIAEPLKFTSAWIELYERVKGEWKMKGTISNFKPDAP